MKAAVLCVFVIGCAHSATIPTPAPVAPKPETNVIFGDAHLTQNLITSAQVEDNDNPYQETPEPTPPPVVVVKPTDTHIMPSFIASAMISVECNNPYEDSTPVDEHEEVIKSFAGCPVGDPLCAAIKEETNVH